VETIARRCLALMREDAATLAAHAEKQKQHNKTRKLEEFEGPEKRVRLDGNVEAEHPIDETASAARFV
jgi:hypothetical protein